MLYLQPLHSHNLGMREWERKFGGNYVYHHRYTHMGEQPLYTGTAWYVHQHSYKRSYVLAIRTTNEQHQYLAKKVLCYK